MARADYSVGTKVTADVSNFEKGMNKAEKALKDFSNKLADNINRLGKKGLVGSIANVTLAMQGLTQSFNTVIKFAKDVGKAVNECTEAYKGQVIAERALNTAIANNPFISGESSKALLQFASDMQKVTNYGDDELIPMMTNLVSLGRTEAETMQIMSVAMDMSAGMGISLDTAITQLNATLNGNIGRLGQQNAELKGLTEEELKQGKAIEILGEKFKGLSGATADTSKQLQNIKGDFKEALGQFTLPSSDLWNKFWAGFYEKGIEVLRKLDDYIDINTVGKKIFENIQDEAKKIAKSKKLKIGDVLGDFNFISEQLSGLSEKELSVLKKSLEGIKDRTDIEQYWLNIVSKRLHNIELEADQERANAKAEAERAKAEEERLAREKELAELRKKQAEEKAKKEKELAETKGKQLKIQREWEDKLFNIRIENLEKTRERELENEKLTEEQKEKIVSFYGDQILAMRLQQIEKNREEALNAENVTEESRLAINLYYENEITKAKQEEEKKRNKAKKEELKDEEEAEVRYFTVIAKLAGDTFKRVAKQIVSTVKNVLSGIGNIFTKVIEFNPNDALDNLLKFEDAVLTFFVETLPKLPSFFASAIQSIMVLIETVISLLDFDTITSIVESILKSILSGVTHIAEYLKQNADKITDGLVQLVSTIVQSLADWVESGGWKVLLDAFLTLQKGLEKIVTENLPAIVDTIIAMLPDLIDFLVNSIVSASKALGKMMKPILKLIVKLIEAIIEVAFSDEVIDASFDVIEDFVEALIETIIEMLPKILPRLIAKLLKTILRSLVEFPVRIAGSFLSGMIKAFQKTDWLKFVKDCFMGLIDGFKELFGIHSPSTVFEGFGKNIMEGLLNGLKSLTSNVQNFFTNLWSKITNVFNGAGDWFKSTFSKCADGIKNAFDGMKDWFSKLWDNITNTASSAVEKIKEAGNKAGEAIKKGATGKNDDPASTATRVGIGILTGGISEIGHGLGWWANGTNNAPSGLSIVGEAGPELVKFRGGEQILNNRNTNKALANMGKSTNNFNVTFNNLQDTTAFAMMNQLKAYNRQMAINGII